MWSRFRQTAEELVAFARTTRAGSRRCCWLSTPFMADMNHCLPAVLFYLTHRLSPTSFFFSPLALYSWMSLVTKWSKLGGHSVAVLQNLRLQYVDASQYSENVP